MDGATLAGIGFDAARNVTPRGEPAPYGDPLLTPAEPPRRSAQKPWLTGRGLTLLAILASSLAAIACGVVALIGQG